MTKDEFYIEFGDTDFVFHSFKGFALTYKAITDGRHVLVTFELDYEHMGHLDLLLRMTLNDLYNHLLPYYVQGSINGGPEINLSRERNNHS